MREMPEAIKRNWKKLGAVRVTGTGKRLQKTSLCSIREVFFLLETEHL
jgi:hypothetical protein